MYVCVYRLANWYEAKLQQTHLMKEENIMLYTEYVLWSHKESELKKYIEENKAGFFAIRWIIYYALEFLWFSLPVDAYDCNFLFYIIHFALVALLWNEYCIHDFSQSMQHCKHPSAPSIVHPYTEKSHNKHTPYVWYVLCSVVYDAKKKPQRI